MKYYDALCNEIELTEKYMPRDHHLPAMDPSQTRKMKTPKTIKKPKKTINQSFDYVIH